jgi:hypothetical protein
MMTNDRHELKRLVVCPWVTVSDVPFLDKLDGEIFQEP